MLDLNPGAGVRALVGCERRHPVCNVLVTYFPSCQRVEDLVVEVGRTFGLVQVIGDGNKLGARQIVGKSFTLGGSPVACTGDPRLDEIACS